MRHLIFVLAIATLSSFVVPLDTLSKKERKFAIASLKETRNDVIKSVKGLSEEQLNYKPAADRWSVKECIYHIALSEDNLWKWVDGVLKAPANPEKRQDIKTTDEQVIKALSDRSTKRKTYEALEPASAKFSSVADALQAFAASRQKLIEYIKTTPDDMRNHIAVETPMGPLDAYQLVLLISSHSNRHLQQLNEVKADAGFPAN